MGVDFVCQPVDVYCSYGGWNDIREAILQASLQHLHQKHANHIALHEGVNEDDEHWFGEGSYYYIYHQALLEWEKTIQPILTGRYRFLNLIDNFNKQCYDLKFINAWRFFGLGGLDALCRQSDCEGMYTPGNSLDIYLLLTEIRPCLEPLHPEIYTSDSSSLYELFQHSSNTQQPVTIC